MKSAKTMAIIGSIVSLVFSFIGYIMFLVLSLSAKTQEFEDSFAESYVETGSQAEINDMIEMVTKFFNVMKNVSLIFLVVGIVLLVLALIVKASNKTPIGVVFIITSILHLFTLRLVAFVLLLIAGIKILGYKEVVETGEPLEPVNA